METRRLISFLFVSLGFVLIWRNFFAPPPPVPAPAAPQVDVVADDSDSEAGADSSAEGDADAGGEQAAAAIEHHDAAQVTLGSLDADSGYALEATFTTAGAAVESVRLTDPRMKDLTDHSAQVQVIGGSGPLTLSSRVNVIDEQLAELGEDQDLSSVDWQLAAQESDSVTFSYTAPDHSLEVRKTYRIRRISDEADAGLRNDPGAYTITCELQLRNLSEGRSTVQYELNGPSGVVLENIEHTRKYRDIKLEFLGDEGSALTSAKTVQGLWSRDAHPSLTQKQIEALVREGDEKWTAPVRYVGVDVQFFAALISPGDERSLAEQQADPWIDRIFPVLLQSDQDPYRADISFCISATPRVLQPAGESGDSLTHSYSLFVGPKHRDLLDPPPFSAEKVLDYGSWFGFIARVMHSVLSFLFEIGLPYWLAIISLTVMVRCCLFPLSRKQAISSARMKELQPKINELKLKYGEDKEKMARAQMELWRKHKINPMGGCLPVFFQLPVFIGLYTCLNTAVDLRLSSFLWIENLAAPDALARLPFSLPLLGQDFNLLPCINVVLFLVQQKLFMPPPADEQQEMQHKMMNYMTIVFAVMFWHVPAGLCIYFVASSLWSIGERKLLGSGALTPASTLDDDDTSASVTVKRPGESDSDSAEPKEKGFLERMVERMTEAAEQAQKQAEQNHRNSGGGGKGKSKGKNKGKGRR